MKVTIVGHTMNPVDLLILSKNTRLNMSADLLDHIANKTIEDKKAELDYMVRTIKSSWEFFDITFLIEGVSRAFTHQFVRNRQGSYAQQTMRILGMVGFEYVTGPTILADEALKEKYDKAMKDIDEVYQDLIANGAAIEDARGVLPTNICTNIIAKYNLRSLSDMMASRASSRTQGEYRDVIEAMYQACISKWPWLESFLRDQKHHALKELESIVHDRFDGTPQGTRVLKLIDQVRNAKY